MTKMSIKSIRLEQVVRFNIKGSVLAGTVRSRMIGLDTHIHVESEEPPERIQRLIQIGEQTCYTLQALQNPVQVNTFATLNGQDLLLERVGTSSTHS
jgi:organic hydroperoxide reductase OsmC/OhrA